MWEMKIHLVRGNTAVSVYALINAWLPCSRAHAWAWVKNSVHAATLPGARASTAPSFLIRHRWASPIPELYNVLVPPSVTNIINQELGRTYFTIYLIACMHGCREAKRWHSRDWSVWSEDSSKWISQTRHWSTPYDELSVCKHKLQDWDGSWPLLSQQILY